MSAYLGRNPLIGKQINWLHPLSKDLVGCFLFNENSGGNLRNIANTSLIDDLTFDTNDLSWIGQGLFFDNTQNALTPIIINSPRPGWWHDTFNKLSVFALVTLELDTGSILTLLDIGGSTQGLYIGYKTASNTIVYGTAQTNTRVEILSTTLFAPSIVPFSIGTVYNQGKMELFINGNKENNSTNGTQIPSRGGQPGIGACDGTLAGSNAILVGNTEEWGGKIIALYFFDRALTDSDFFELNINPYAFMVPDLNPALSVAGAPTLNLFNPFVLSLQQKKTILPLQSKKRVSSLQPNKTITVN